VHSFNSYSLFFFSLSAARCLDSLFNLSQMGTRLDGVAGEPREPRGEDDRFDRCLDRVG
jgi:hypothetical protein